MSEKTFLQQLDAALRLAEGSGAHPKAKADALADKLLRNFTKHHANPSDYYADLAKRDQRTKPLKLKGKSVEPPELDKHGVQKRKR